MRHGHRFAITGNKRCGERDVIIATKAYARSRVEAARALGTVQIDTPPFFEYAEQDRYVRERAAHWLRTCRTDFLAAIAEECEARDESVATVTALDIDLPDVARLTKYLSEQEALQAERDLRSVEEETRAQRRKALNEATRDSADEVRALL